MKKLMMIAIMVTGLFLTVSSVSYAVTPLALDGNDYAIMAFCTNDAGDYCSKGDIKHDAFTFEDDDNFIVDSFDGGVLGVGGRVSLMKTDSLLLQAMKLLLITRWISIRLMSKE